MRRTCLPCWHCCRHSLRVARCSEVALPLVSSAAQRRSLERCLAQLRQACSSNQGNGTAGINTTTFAEKAIRHHFAVIYCKPSRHPVIVPAGTDAAVGRLVVLRKHKHVSMLPLRLPQPDVAPRRPRAAAVAGSALRHAAPEGSNVWTQFIKTCPHGVLLHNFLVCSAYTLSLSPAKAFQCSTTICATRLRWRLQGQRNARRKLVCMTSMLVNLHCSSMQS